MFSWLSGYSKINNGIIALIIVICALLATGGTAALMTAFDKAVGAFGNTAEVRVMEPVLKDEPQRPSVNGGTG